jgi:hypothetical protein
MLLYTNIASNLDVVFIVYSIVDTAANTTVAEPLQKKARTDPFADLRDNLASSQVEHPLAESLSCEEELARYKALRVPSASKNPLQFWRDNTAAYPILAHTARRIFCISASSAQSERDFSSVGHTITDMRSRLSSEKVEAIEMVRWGMRAGLLKK